MINLQTLFNIPPKATLQSLFGVATRSLSDVLGVKSVGGGYIKPEGDNTIEKATIKNGQSSSYFITPQAYKQETGQQLSTQLAKASPAPRILPNKTPLQSFVPKQYIGLIAESATKHRVDPKLLASIVMTENRGWNPKAINSEPGSTATGLGQITNATKRYIAKNYQDFRRDDPKMSLDAMAWFINDISKRIGSTDPKDIANAYNQGVGGHLQGRRNRGYINTAQGFSK